MPGTFNDQSELAQLFQQAYSPISNYSQGALALAIQRRAQADRTAEQQRQEAAHSDEIQRQEQFQLQRDQSQSALVMAREQQIEKMRLDAETQRQKQQFDFQQKLQDAADKRARERLKDEWDHSDKSAKDKLLTDLKGKASEMGLSLPPSALSQDEQFDKLHREIGTAQSQKAMNLISSGRKLNDQFNALTDTTDAERVKETVSRFLSSEGAKVLTADEQKSLQADSSKIFPILARLKLDTSQKGQAAAAEVQTDWFSAESAAREFYASKAKNPELLRKIQGDYALQQTALHAALSDPNLPPGIFENMFDSVVEKAKQEKKDQAPQPPPLPPVSAVRGGGAPAVSGPGVAAPGITGAPVGPGSRLPDRAVRDPYGTLMALVNQEQQGKPKGGSLFSGDAPLSISQGDTPVSDLFFNELGATMGLQPQQVGSSVFTRSPGYQVSSQIGNPAMVARLNSIPPAQQNQIAGRVLNSIWSDPNNPGRTRFLRWLQDNQRVQNATAPTAFPSPEPIVIGGDQGLGF